MLKVMSLYFRSNLLKYLSPEYLSEMFPLDGKFR